MKRVIYLLVIALGSAECYAAEPADPRGWLTEMNQAFSTLNYDGEFSFYNGSDLASLRIVHMLVDGEQRERLLHLNGAPREFIRKGEDVDCILMPGDDLLALMGGMPEGPFARAFFIRRFDNISEYYRLSFAGEDRVANRIAVRVSVAPLDENRYGYRLWLDKSTRLLLRSELIDSQGTKLEIFQFNRLQLGSAVQQQALEPESQQGSRVVTHLTLATLPTAPVSEPQVSWELTWLPAGFTLTAAEVRARPNELKSINTMMYDDGLTTFSVFVEDMPADGATSMVSRNGATVGVSHLTPGPNASIQLVTLVGELPTATAQRIAQSIQFNAAP